jgi:hypothetical protein
MPTSYSWNPVSDAVGYLVTLENTTTHQIINHDTTTTSISLVGTPSGNYKITVKAKFADGSTSIIVEDEVEI